MSKKSNLPVEVHDHFRKANVLHGYVEEDLGKAQDHALELGDELLAAKKAVPHGRWEDECERFFDPSARTARFYMQFARDMGALPKRQRTAVLMLEGTLDGAAKAAKKAAKPTAATPTGGEQLEPIDVDSEPVDYGKCPNCAGAKWTVDDDEAGDVTCSKCLHPHGEPAGDVDEDRLKTQRQKTVKTAEALMRAFDDLQCMKARAEHSGAIQACKQLLKTAKEWK